MLPAAADLIGDHPRRLDTVDEFAPDELRQRLSGEPGGELASRAESTDGALQRGGFSRRGGSRLLGEKSCDQANDEHSNYECGFRTNDNGFQDT